VRICKQLPLYFFRTALKAAMDSQWRRIRILIEEFLGFGIGLQYLVRPGWRKRRAPPFYACTIEPRSGAAE
jgi:hypothetical protein